MTGYIMPAALPLITAAAGLMLRKYGKQKLFCFLFGVLLFTAPFIPQGFDCIGKTACPPVGTEYLLFLEGFPPIGQYIKPIISALCAMCAAMFIYRRCAEQCAGAVMYAVCGFVFCLNADISLYIAATLCLASTGFIYEIRFFRFAAVILLAACFDMRALLMAPIFFLAQVKRPEITLLICIAAGAALFIFPCGEALFGLLPDEQFGAYAIPAAAIIVTAVFAAFGTLTYRLFGKNGGFSVMNVNLLITCCLIAAVSYTDGRFAPLALFTAIAPMTVVGSELFSVGLKLVKGTFKDSKAAVVVWHAFCGAVAAAICAVMILSGIFGLSDVSVFGEAIS